MCNWISRWTRETERFKTVLSQISHGLLQILGRLELWLVKDTVSLSRVDANGHNLAKHLETLKSPAVGLP